MKLPQEVGLITAEMSSEVKVLSVWATEEGCTSAVGKSLFCHLETAAVVRKQLLFCF